MAPGSSPLCWDHRVKPARSSGCNAARAFAVWTQRCPRADDRRLAAIWSGNRTAPQQNSDHVLPGAVEGLLQVGEQLVRIHDAEHDETIVVTRGGRRVALEVHYVAWSDLLTVVHVPG